jgi:O-antigen/teichoic acid export membrane protein
MSDAISPKNKNIKILTLMANLVTKGHNRSVNAKKNILATLLIRGGSILISLFLVPLTIHYVNPTQYGIWVTLSSIIGWFGFFDIGFGHGLRNNLAVSIAKGEHGKARIYVSTTYAILTIIIIIVLLVFLIVNPFLDWSKILNSPRSMSAELSSLALIVFSLFCLQFVLQLITTVLMANQQPAKAFLFIFFGNLLSAIVIFVLAKTTSGNLIYLGAAYSIAPLLALIFSSFWFYSRKYKIYSPSFKYVDFGYARNLMTIGGKFFIIQISGIVLYQTSNIIIIQLFGAAEVTPYNIAFKYFSVIPMVVGIIMTPFWSAYTEAWIKKDFGWIKSSISKLKVLWLILSIITLIMLIFSNFIYAFWIGKKIVIPFSLSAVIALYVVINAWNAIYSQFLNGVGKIKLQLYKGILDMLINIPLAIFLGHKYGVQGIILSSVILCSINMIWETVQYNKIINNRARGIWAQ